jgi:DNA-binding beta-propeller fold protein YncE
MTSHAHRGATVGVILLTLAVIALARTPERDASLIPSAIAAQTSVDVGTTVNLVASTDRLAASTHTSTCRPWQMVSAAGAGFLSGVAAVAANNVWAVGATSQDPTRAKALIEHWDGTQWHVVSGASIAAPSQLRAVAAITANDIWAVGSSWPVGKSPMGVIAHWDGQRWRIVDDATHGRGAAAFTAVAELSSNNVWLAGSDDAGAMSVVEHWDGRTWRPTEDGNFDGATIDALAAVSSRDIWAGGDIVGNYRSALIEHWDGARWVYANMPEVGKNFSIVSAIAAVSASDVWAVGSAGDEGAGGDALIEHWDGRRWRLVVGPDGPSGALTSVAAVSAHDVWAVGGNLVEHWDGTRWQIVPGAADARALAVVSATEVWTVGGIPHPEQPAIAHYAGHLCSWTVPRVHVLPFATLGLEQNPGAIAMLDNERTRRLFLASATRMIVLNTSTRAMVYAARLPVTALTSDRTGQHVYAAVQPRTGQPYVAVLDGTTGRLVRTLHDSASTVQLVADDQTGTVFALHNAAMVGAQPSGQGCGETATPACALTMIDTETGSIAQTIPLTNPTELALDQSAGRVFVSSSDGVSIFDARTGAFDALLPLTSIGPTHAPLVTLDEPADLAFVSAITVTTDQTTPTEMLTITEIRASSGAIMRTITVDTGQDLQDSQPLVDQRAQRVLIQVTGGETDYHPELKILDLATGAATAVLGLSGCSFTVDQATGRVYAACQPEGYIGDAFAASPVGLGAVGAFDETTGALEAMVRVDADPYHMLVDPSTDQVFVLTQASLTILDGASITMH